MMEPRQRHVGLFLVGLVVMPLAVVSPVRAAQGMEDEVYIVREGETRVVTPQMRNLKVKRWVMGDGATIRLPLDIGSWSVYAEEAQFGSGTSIVGAGNDGGNGGRDGGAGVRGQNGVNVYLDIGLVSLGELTVDVRGGNGGSGGQGRTGPRVDRCGTTGGFGGPGGVGGDGGDGGSVSVRYWIPSGGGVGLAGDGIRVLSTGGTPGVGGEGGRGGSSGCYGGGGRNSEPYYRRGAQGPGGPRGADGFRGVDGTSELLALALAPEYGRRGQEQSEGEQVVVELARPVPWGSWTGAQYCPDGSVVVGMEQRVEEDQGRGDDAGMTGLRFFCRM